MVKTRRAHPIARNRAPMFEPVDGRQLFSTNAPAPAPKPAPKPTPPIVVGGIDGESTSSNHEAW